MSPLFVLLSVATAIFLHEMGHLLTAAWLGIPVRSIAFRMTGAALTFDFSHTSYGREALVHLGGAGAGVLSAALATLLFGERAYHFAGLSLSLAAVNLLPVSGFDGGGILRCLLSIFFLPDTVWRIGHLGSVTAVLLLWGVVLWIEMRVQPNLSLMAFTLCLLFSALQGDSSPSP